MGYFAVLVIATDDVKLMLNGHTIKQDPPHPLMQRFFAIIELASSPSLKGVGPGQFVSDELVPARHFVLDGQGTIGE